MSLEVDFEFEWNLQALALTIIEFRKRVIFYVTRETNCGLGCLVVEVSRSYTIRHTHTGRRSPLSLSFIHSFIY